MGTLNLAWFENVKVYNKTLCLVDAFTVNVESTLEDIKNLVSISVKNREFAGSLSKEDYPLFVDIINKNGSIEESYVIYKSLPTEQQKVTTVVLSRPKYISAELANLQCPDCGQELRLLLDEMEYFFENDYVYGHCNTEGCGDTKEYYNKKIEVEKRLLLELKVK